MDEDEIVVFRRKLENLLLVIAKFVMLPVNMCKSNDFSLRRLRSKAVGVSCETGVDCSVL